MNENLAKARDKFIEGGGRLASGMGLPRIMGQLYATLFFGDKSLSLDEMAQNLKISKGSASVNIRELEKLRAVRKVRVKGDRKDFYQVEPDFEKVIIDGVIDAAKRRMEIALSIVNESESLINKARLNLDDEEETKRADLYLKRTENLISDDIRRWRSKANARRSYQGSRPGL